MKKKFLLCFSLLTFLPAVGLATSLTLESSRGSGYESWSLLGDYDLERASENSSGRSLSFDVSSSKSQTTDSNGLAITDNTRSATVGADYDSASRTHWSAGASLSLSSTPEENLSESGGVLTAGYTHYFENEDSEQFTQRAAVSFSFGSTNYVQNFTDQVPRRNGSGVRPRQGQNTITQRSVGVKLRYRPTDYFQVKIKGTTYSYSKDINEFLSYLDVQTNLGAASGMSSAVSGFARSSTGLELNFYFLESWEFDLEASQSQIISDGSTTRKWGGTLAKDFGVSWQGSLEILKSSNTLSSSSESTTTTMSVQYTF